MDFFGVNCFSDYFSLWYFAAFAVTGYISYYLHEVVQYPILACGDGKYREFLETNVPILREKFWPTIWCWEPRFQTVFGHLIRQFVIPSQPYRREVLNLSDGGQVALDWREDNIPAEAPILIALPGLTGTSDVEYMKNIVLNVHAQGIRCVVFNNRGLGGLPLKTDRAYCATFVDDLNEVVRHVRKCHPKPPIAVLGVSMGGLLVGNFLASETEESRTLAAAVLISPPWNVFIGTESIETTFINNLLGRKLASGLVDAFARSSKWWENSVDVNAVMSSKTIREFDTNFTSKVFGYNDLVDYYSNACIHEKIEKFPVPTLCLSAADDPFQPIHGIPLEAAQSSKHVAIVVPARGGHIGFMEGFLPFSSKQYMQRLVSQYLGAILHNENYRNFYPS